MCLLMCEGEGGQDQYSLSGVRGDDAERGGSCGAIDCLLVVGKGGADVEGMWHFTKTKIETIRIRPATAAAV